MRPDTHHSSHSIRKSRVSITVELSDRGIEVLRILDGLFNSEPQELPAIVDQQLATFPKSGSNVEDMTLAEVQS